MAINETLLAQVLGIVTLAFLGGFWFLPGGVLALRRRALGELQVDVRLGYSVGDHQDPRLFGWLRGFIRKAFLEGTGLEGLVRAVMAEGRRR